MFDQRILWTSLGTLGNQALGIKRRDHDMGIPKCTKIQILLMLMRLNKQLILSDCRNP